MKGRFHHWPLLEEDTDEESSDLDDVHTSDNPYCDDLDCWCHSDVEYHEDATHPDVTDEEITTAHRFFGFAWGGR